MSALESQMPPVKRAQMNGIEMAYYEAGPRRGVPIVLCHGFPELAFSWRHQLKALSEAGRWVIAPDQRGYGLTDQPDDVLSYDLENLCADLIALLDQKGIAKAIFVGHDWGGIIVWHMAIRHPDRVAGVIGLNTPFNARPPVDPSTLHPPTRLPCTARTAAAPSTQVPPPEPSTLHSPPGKGAKARPPSTQVPLPSRLPCTAGPARAQSAALSPTVAPSDPRLSLSLSLSLSPSP